MKSRKIVVIQTSVPDYRIGFFEELGKHTANLLVVAGSISASSSEEFSSALPSWRVRLENRFCFGGQVLWQKRAVSYGFCSGTLVLEWNPRILSNWVILATRVVLGRRTLVWGHAYSRVRRSVFRHFVRDWMAGLSDGVIAYTASEATIISMRNPGLPVWAAPNSGIRVNLMNEEPVCDAAAIRDVIYVGRLSGSKKTMFLLRAWEVALTRLPRCPRLIFVGDGPEKASMEAFVSERKLENFIVFLGHISDQKELERLYRTALFSVSPGYVGLAAVQSLSFGVPVLISRSENHAPEIESCVEGENCLFFDSNDISSFLSKVEDFLCDSDSWIQRRSSISKRALASYSIEKMAERYADAVVGLSDSDGSPRVGIVWAQYGPYHIARIEKMRQISRNLSILGIEISSKTSTYRWGRSSTPSYLNSLEQNVSFETLSPFRVYLRALRFIEASNLSVVFVPSYWPASSMAVLLAAKTAGVKTVLMNDSHALTARAKGVLILVKSALVRSYDAGLVAGTPHREYFVKLGLRPDRIYDGYDVIDNTYFEDASNRARMDSSELRKLYSLPEKYVLSVGRMEEKKNLDALVIAYSKARRFSNNFEVPSLVLVGDGSCRERLRALCLRLSLSVFEYDSAFSKSGRVDADVLFVGFRQVEQLPVFYGLASMFVLPSLEEEWGLVVNEAMACGLPVLVSKVAGCARDLIREGENGYTFDPYDSDDLANKLLSMFVSDRLDEMGRNSKYIIGNWSCDRFARSAHKAVLTVLDL